MNQAHTTNPSPNPQIPIILSCSLNFKMVSSTHNSNHPLTNITKAHLKCLVTAKPFPKFNSLSCVLLVNIAVIIILNLSIQREAKIVSLLIVKMRIMMIVNPGLTFSQSLVLKMPVPIPGWLKHQLLNRNSLNRANKIVNDLLKMGHLTCFHLRNIALR